MTHYTSATLGFDELTRMIKAGEIGRDVVPAGMQSIQIQATLALHEAIDRLAEQQKVANMLAYWQLHTPRNIEDSLDGMIEVSQIDGTPDFENKIREALGLDND